MSTTVTFRPLSGPAVAVDLTNQTRFASMGQGAPDVFQLRGAAGAWTLIIANGKVDDQSPGKAIGRIDGQILVHQDGQQLVDQPISIEDGCTHDPFRFGPRALDQNAIPGDSSDWTLFWLRHWPKDSAARAAIIGRLNAVSLELNEFGFNNPDQSKASEQRVCQSVWHGTLATCLGLRGADVRKASLAFVDYQLKYRHAVYYRKDGVCLRADDSPFWRQGPKGWDGKVKRPSASPAQFETVQHIAPDRQLYAAVVLQDEAGIFYNDAYFQCMLTRPEFRDSQVADDQRSTGYCIKLAALQLLVDPTDTDAQKGLMSAVTGLRHAMGFAKTGEPYVSIAPAHTGKWSHGYPSWQDWLEYKKALGLEPPMDQPTLHAPNPDTKLGPCDHLRPWLREAAEEHGLKPDTYTDGADGLWQGHNIVWQTAVIVGALCIVRDIPAAAALIKDVSMLIKHAVAAIVGPGMNPGTGPEGEMVLPYPVHDAYTSRNPKRVMRGPGKNSTTTWICNPVLASRASLGPTLVAKAEALAHKIWTETDFPKPPSLEIMGLLPIREFGLKK